jgi:hypothetical protein
VPFFLAINIGMNTIFVMATLIDITQTHVIRGNSKQRDQQRNWETVLQVLGLKTQPLILEGPVQVTGLDFERHTGWFGDFYRDFPGTHAFWGVRFTSELVDFYSIENLYNDFEQVPIITGLDETVKFMLPIFHSHGSLKNIHFLEADELNSY